MKRALLLDIAIALAVATSSYAQKSTPGGFVDFSGGSRGGYMMVVPKEFSYSGKPLLTVQDRENENLVSIYDENIDLVKSFEIDQSKTFDYSLMFQTESREVTSVTQSSFARDNTGTRLQEWLWMEEAKYTGF